MPTCPPRQTSGPPIHADDDPPAPLRFERRAAPRTEAIGSLRALRRDFPPVPGWIDLRLRDESDGGFAAHVNEPLGPGTPLDVRVCPMRDHWRLARVVRCLPVGDGYLIGVAYEMRRAA